MLSGLFSRMLASAAGSRAAAAPKAGSRAADRADCGIGGEQLPLHVIDHPLHIACMLQDLADRRQPVTLMSPAIHGHACTRIVAADAGKRRVLIRQLQRDDLHEAVLQDGHVNLGADHAGTPLLFTLRILGTFVRERVPCYRLDFPGYVLRVQMRECMRMRPAAHLRGSVRAATLQAAVPVRIADISESGIGFELPACFVEPLRAGATLNLADPTAAGMDLQAINVVVKNVSPGPGQTVRIGAAIETRSATQLRRLRQYVLMHQRSSFNLRCR